MKSAENYANEILKELDKLTRYSKTNKIDLFHEWLEGQSSLLASITGLDENMYEAWLRKSLKTHLNNNQKISEGFSKIFDILEEGLTETKEDILGIVYMSLSPDKHLGQNFTPSSISELISKIVNADNNSEPEPENIADFCCGSGALGLSRAKEMLDKGKSLDDFTITAYDIDMICVKMAALQFNILDYDAVIVRQDILKQDEPNVFYTVRHAVTELGYSTVSRLAIKAITTIAKVNNEILNPETVAQ